MNSQSQEQTPAQEVPLAKADDVAAPYAEQAGALASGEAAATAAVEQAISTAQPPGAAATDPPAVTTPAASPAAPTPGATTTALPQVADDTDLIEKEWVEKAKEIVALTAQDPHAQNQEINRMKADYLKKRYNKDIKLTDD